MLRGWTWGRLILSFGCDPVRVRLLPARRCRLQWPRASPLERAAIMQQVTVRVPASTSNLGPGFDCLGVALRVYNHVTLSRVREGRLPAMVRSAANGFFKSAG